MTFTAAVLYPSSAKFDMDYYKEKHMPLVSTKWKEFGLKSWKVSHSSDPNATYGVVCTLLFENMEGFQTAVKEKGSEVFGDVDHFSDTKPVLYTGDVVLEG